MPTAILVARLSNTTVKFKAIRQLSMPVKSLNSSVIRWPNKAEVSSAAANWARELVSQRPEILRIGIIGSYGREDWGVGSDLDLIVVVKDSSEQFEARNLGIDVSSLPVPVDLMVYTEAEWRKLSEERGRFYETVVREGNWIYGA
jgi:predicted nucleotidyltransferase